MTILAVFALQVGVIATLILVTQNSVDKAASAGKTTSLEIAEIALHLSLQDLAKATDGQDNDGDGEIDEGVHYDNPLLHPDIVKILEGRLGRLGTWRWTPADDANRNGHPDFGETGVEPVTFAGGELIAYTVFTQADAIDNDWDGAVDEPDEAGGVTGIALGRFQSYVSLARYSGTFTRLFIPPGSPGWSPSAAVASGGNILLEGSCTVRGALGHVHANRFLNITGPVRIEGNATAAGGAALSPKAHIGGRWGDGTKNPLPRVEPEAFRARADYRLDTRGWVHRRRGGREEALCDMPREGPCLGWSLGESNWLFSGVGLDAGSLRGTWFVEGDVHVLGTGHTGLVSLRGGGGGTQTLRMAIVATGSIEISGNTHIETCRDDGLLLVAGGEIRVNGNDRLDQVLFGTLAARRDIVITGNPEIVGAVVVSDPVGDESPEKGIRITGGANVTFCAACATPLPVLDPQRPWFVLEPVVTGTWER